MGMQNLSAWMYVGLFVWLAAIGITGSWLGAKRERERWLTAANTLPGYVWVDGAAYSVERLATVGNPEGTQSEPSWFSSSGGVWDGWAPRVDPPPRPVVDAAMRHLRDLPVRHMGVMGEIRPGLPQRDYLKGSVGNVALGSHGHCPAHARDLFLSEGDIAEATAATERRLREVDGSQG